jgi:glycosyltransferase involved in cell wall biosynthesis
MLRQALRSIRAVEGPGISFEILVGDNGRDSATQAVAQKYGAVYISVSQKGAGAARNAGLKAATGEFLAFLDDDDVWLPDHIRPQIAILDERSDLDAIISRVQSADFNLKATLEPWPLDHPGEGADLLRRMLSGYFPQIGGVVARRSVRERIGEFDQQLIGGQDLDWLLRIARGRKLGYCSTVAVLFRGRPDGSYDALQRLRIGYDSRVFLRHALPEWRIWKSPRDFSKAYYGTLVHFYSYFEEAALARARRGERSAAISAVASAFRVFPLRASAHLVLPRTLRTALWSALLPAMAPHRQTASND